MRCFTLGFLFLVCETTAVFSQLKELKGLVVSTKGEKIFAASVSLKKNKKANTTTNLNGYFELRNVGVDDTLVIQSLGYSISQIPVNQIHKSILNTFILYPISRKIRDVEIKWKNPISEKFAVETLKPLDIYLNPNAAADPLKAITILPFATTTDESANPSLRGGTPDRTRVYMNGIPIYNPVRNSQINGIGNFSLFNTELIDKENVYASNPPLTFGNTSAGLVEINTLKNLKKNQLQLSPSLANVGFFVSQKMDSHSFVQFYGNVQFSNAYLAVNKAASAGLYNFGTKDLGANYNLKINRLMTFNTFNYFISEKYKADYYSYTFDSILNATRNRFFSLNNLTMNTVKGSLTFNCGVDYSFKTFRFGNIDDKNEELRIFSSLNYKWNPMYNTTVQVGISYDYYRSLFRDTIPLFYYGLSQSDPKYAATSDKINTLIEPYIYYNWDMNKKFSLFSGFRSSIPTNNQTYYLSSQLGAKYNIDGKHNFLLSGGNYNSYSMPFQITDIIYLLNSKQLEADYTLNLKKFQLKSAIYYKEDDIVNYNYSTKNFGVELFLEKTFFKSIKFNISNTFLHQTVQSDNISYVGNGNLKYFVKSTLSYNNPDWFNISLVYMGRSGSPYTPAIGSNLNPFIQTYEPIYSPNTNSSVLGAYNRLDLSFNKYMSCGKKSLIVFFTLNNLFNTKNECAIQYFGDYKTFQFNYLQLRSVYFGVVVHLGH